MTYRIECCSGYTCSSSCDGEFNGHISIQILDKICEVVIMTLNISRPVVNLAEVGL